MKEAIVKRVLQPFESGVTNPDHLRLAFLLARRRQLTGSHRSTRSARSDAVNPVVQPAVHTSAPTRTTVHQGNAIASTAALQPQQVQTRDEIPIAPATTSVRNRPRFRALALFRRRPQQRVDRPSSRQPKTCTATDIECRLMGLDSMATLI